jgi:pimeloyl-ACP methyl ester carboxylesterase
LAGETDGRVAQQRASSGDEVWRRTIVSALQNPAGRGASPCSKNKPSSLSVSPRPPHATRLRQPCLLVRGADSDVLSAGIAREFIELAANAILAEVPHAGHMVAGDNNDAFATAIRAWLDTFALNTSPRPTTNGGRHVRTG